MPWAAQNRKKLNKISKAEKVFAEMLKDLHVFAHRNWAFQVKGGKYRFVDFMLRKRKIIFEIDGPEHNEEKDRAREEEIRQVFKNFRIIRFTNDEVLNDQERIKDFLMQAIL